MEPLPKQNDPKSAAPKEDATKAINDKIDAIADRVIAAFIKINRANRKADSAEYERNHRREQRRFKVEISEIFLIFVYCCATLYECHVFHVESDTMKSEFQASQLSNSNQLVALQGQLTEMKRGPELDERPWVFTEFTNNAIALQPNGCVFTIWVRNTGKTPAINVGTFETVTTDINRIPPSDDRVEGLKYALAPNAFNVLPYPVTPYALLQLEQGKTLYFYGTVFYEDIFGREHWTQFCYSVYNKGTNIVQLLIHNSCDTETNQTQ